MNKNFFKNFLRTFKIYKMENKELEPTSPITTTEKKTKPKDPGRIAAGKKKSKRSKKGWSRK